MATETWAPVAGHEGFYVVSDHGHVKSLLFDPVGRPMTPLVYRKGYLKFAFARPAYSRDFAHRVVWQAFRGPIPEGVTVNHINGIKNDNRLDNLELASHAEQFAHAIRAGLRPPPKLSIQDARDIRAIYADLHWSAEEIAKLYDISPSMVRQLVNRPPWSRLSAKWFT